MVNHTFGRRGVPQHPSGHAIEVPENSTQNTRVESTERPSERLVLMSQKTEFPPLDDELQQWNQARKQNFPWRSLSLVASLSFGIASFVLPNSVNDMVNCFLYALAAASLYVGFSKRRQTKS